MIRNTTAALKILLPTWFKAWLRKPSVLYQSQNQNVYHCTVQKCASQWVRAILSDPRLQQYCGLRPYRYQDDLPAKHDPRKLTERRFEKPFPGGAIATTVYVDYDGFASIPKPARYKAFFVMRDPRDVLVSWYFSSKISHPLMGDLARVRADLNRLPEPDGLLYSLDYLEGFGLFAAQRSWAGAADKDPNVRLFRFEDLIADGSAALFEQICQHCDIQIPYSALDAIWRTYKFEQLSGRRPGQEDRSAHYRKGVAGDWRNHFTADVSARFEKVAGDLISLWHYT